MPVFDFECADCKKKFSELVYPGENIICPQCGSDQIKKLFSTFYTLSESTRFETGAKDLPSMAEFQRFKKTGAVKKTSNPLASLAKTKKLKKIKPRAAVHRKKIK